MKEVTIQLTVEQEKFLQTFAQNHYHGAEDNASTANAFHVVENKHYDYIPYSEDLVNFFEDLPLCFTTDTDYDRWWTSEEELILDYYAEHDKVCPIEVKPFQDLLGDSVPNTKGEMVEILDWPHYFERYEVPLQAMAWQKVYWEKIAFFFIKEEAKKYLQYQGHNLHQPRIYTYGAGYGNEGDYIPFRDLLLHIGQTLNRK